MCIVFLALNQHPDYPIVLAANRDEFHQRSSRALHLWEEKTSLAGGRDCQKGGSWLMASHNGRFAAVTNIREGQPETAPLSRGAIPYDFTTSNDPTAYLNQLLEQRDRYAGFNLIAGDANQVWYLNSKDGEIITLSSGVYGLSNGRLDTPWPKLTKGKAHFAQQLTLGQPMLQQALFTLLRDTTQADSTQLPNTGIEKQWEQLLSSIFICHPIYGTRCSTLLFVDNASRSTLIERNFDASSTQLDQRTIYLG